MKEAENLYAEHYVKYKLMNYTLASTVPKKKNKNNFGRLFFPHVKWNFSSIQLVTTNIFYRFWNGQR